MISSTIKAFIISWTVALGAALTAAPITAPNPIYSQTGSVTFDTSSYLFSVNNVLNPATITITYSQSPATAGYRFGYCIKQINYLITSNRLNYSLVLHSLAASSASLYFYTDNANHLLTFIVSYMAIEPLFGNYYFSYRWMRPNRNFFNGDSVSQISSGEGPFNTSLTHQLWITIVGVEATMAANNEIDLYPNAVASTPTTITYSVSTISPTTFFLTSVILHAFIYSSSDLSSLVRPMVVTQASFSCLYNSSTLSYSSSPSQIQSYNVLLGMKQYHIVNLNNLQYSTTVTPLTSISASTIYYLEYSFFDFIILSFPFCPSPTPYLLLANNTCYDTCPTTYYVNSYQQCTLCTQGKCAQCPNNVCSQCVLEYLLNSVNQCKPICGNGLVQPGQDCDDGNAYSRDGCSSDCTIQNHFNCSVPAGSNSSTCWLIDLPIELTSIIKQQHQNRATLTYSLEPSKISQYSTLNWSQVVSHNSNLSLHIDSVQYYSDSGKLDVSISYFENINEKNLQLQFAFPSASPFDQLPIIASTATLKTTNNLALNYYSDKEYTLAKILQYIVLTMAIIALLLFLLGFYCNKLIALELLALYQVTFFSLSSLKDLSPNYQALTYLSLCNGYNPDLFASAPADRRFYPLGLQVSLFDNYNLTFLVILIPLLLSLILYVVNKCKYEVDNQRLSNLSLLMRGEHTFYGLMFSAYNINVSMAIVSCQLSSSTSFSLLEFSLGFLVIATTLVYGLFLNRYNDAFGQFNTHLSKCLCGLPLFYTMMTFERVLVGLSMGYATSSAQNIIILAINVCILILIIVKEIYLEDGQRLRPILNLSICIAIQFLLVFGQSKQQSTSDYVFFAPIVMTVLLLLALPYNLYYFIKAIRAKIKEQTRQEKKELDENQLLSSERAKLKQLNSIFLNANGSVLDSIGSERNQDKNVGILNIKHQLNRVKYEHRLEAHLSQTKENIVTAELPSDLDGI